MTVLADAFDAYSAAGTLLFVFLKLAT